MEPKIQIINSRGPNGELAKVFAREDGMIIGSCDHTGTTRFGEDPTKVEVRFFIRFEDAESYVKDKCREYLGREDVDFLVKEGGPMIVRANQVPPPPPNMRRM